MRRFVVAIACLVPVHRVALGQTLAAPYQVTWRDAASVTAAGALFFVPRALGLPRGAPSCVPCDPATLSAVDRWAVGPASGTAGTVSTVLLAGVAGFAGFAGLREVPAAQARGNAAVLASAVTWTAASTEWLKVLVRRERPVLYTGAAAAAVSDPESQQSFPSGHVSIAFAAATAYHVMARRQDLPHGSRNTLLLYGGAVGVGVLRVVAGRHFPTDVAAGALLGSAIGWLVATVHPTR